MHNSSLAPVLSATFSRDSCWIISSPVVRSVPQPGRVGLVMNLEPLSAPHDLAVQRVLDAVLNSDDDGLVHLVGHDQALTDLAARPSGVFCAHRQFFPSSGSGTIPRTRSWMTV